MPGIPLFRVGEVEAGTLVVRRVEHKHTHEYFLDVLKPAEPPETEAVAVETAEEGTVVD